MFKRIIKDIVDKEVREEIRKEILSDKEFTDWLKKEIWLELDRQQGTTAGKRLCEELDRQNQLTSASSDVNFKQSPKDDSILTVNTCENKEW